MTGAGATASPTLTAEHLAQLRDGSGIAEEVIAERGYRSITRRADLSQFGFSAEQCRAVPGLLIPQYGPDGSNGRYTFKPDRPVEKFEKRKNKMRVSKYLNPQGAGIRIDCPPRCIPHLGNPAIDLWITEGTKKGDSGASHGLCIIVVNGVWGFKGQNEFGGVTVLADMDHIAWNGRTVNIVFDDDVMVKPEVRRALERLVEILKRKGATVNCVYLPKGADGAKVGLDDYLLKHTVEDLQALIEAPRPKPQAAQAQVELLEETPDMIARPLMLLKGKAVAAIWPYIKETIREGVNKDGDIVRYNPPIEKVEQRLMFIRGDGLIFGDGQRDLSELGAAIHLPEIPRPEKLWSTPGVKRFLRGERAKPADVFKQICDVVDRFIDFDKSLTDQRGMCELVACYILATWYLEAFNVIGYVWPNGERGSGKSQLLLILAELGYLGAFILAGGSFAALRDLADYGALLCFDDAENITDPKTTDPEKRTLLLAGNRRGSTVPIKEQRPDGTWGTRHVNTYCARSFSAIKLPDAVLASRTITIPLIRSGDKKRSNADPKEYNLWPHDRQQLIDDLWALAVTHLPALSACERKVNDESDLTGRNLEPWRAILAVALWLDDNDVEGLSKRMRDLSVGYQSERADFESDDLTRLIVCTVCTVCTVDTVLSETPPDFTVTTAEITNKAKELATDDEWGIDPETINSKRVGWVLKRLRLKQAKRQKRGEPRKWTVQNGDLVRWKSVYSIFEEKTEGGQKTNGANGENGENGAETPDEEVF